MSTFSTVSDVFSDPEFSAPGHSLWGLGALDKQYRECTGFLIMPKRPYEWRVDSHGCYKLDNAALGLGPRDQSAHLPVFLHLRNTNIPGPNSIMRSEQAQQRRYDRRHNKTVRSQETTPMNTRPIPNTYVVTLYLLRPYENFASTSLRLVFVTHLYLLFTKFQCTLLLVQWCQDDHSSRYSPMMKECLCGPYSSKVVASRLARYSGIAVGTFIDLCGLRLLAWAQQVVFQDLHHVWALLHGESTKVYVMLLDKIT